MKLRIARCTRCKQAYFRHELARYHGGHFCLDCFTDLTTKATKRYSPAPNTAIEQFILAGGK
jgi:hypothetical protein